MTANQTNQLLDIDALTLKNGLDEQKITLIDVREPGEFAGEHIKGATLLPLSQFDPNSPKLQG
ncbi:MAG: rhodanese-like domain-containing protein, partial [Chroococcales cyanobacterium]